MNLVNKKSIFLFYFLVSFFSCSCIWAGSDINLKKLPGELGSVSGEVAHMLQRRGESLLFYLQNSAEIGLTYEQEAQIRTMHNKLLKTSILDWAQIRVAVLELEEFLNSKKVDLINVNSQLEVISMLESKNIKNMIFSSLKAKNLLELNQRKKFEFIRKKTLGTLLPSKRKISLKKRPHLKELTYSSQIERFKKIKKKVLA